MAGVPRHIKRFDLTATIAVECSECSKRNPTIRAGRRFAVVVQWDDVWVNTESGREYVNVHEGELIVNVCVTCNPAPCGEVTAVLNRVSSCIIFQEPDAWRLKTPAQVTIHHLDGCGLV